MFYHVNDQYSEMFMNINNTSRYVQAVYTDTCDVKMFFFFEKSPSTFVAVGIIRYVKHVQIVIEVLCHLGKKETFILPTNIDLRGLDVHGNFYIVSFSFKRRTL